jgi:hypothetical protein
MKFVILIIPFFSLFLNLMTPVKINFSFREDIKNLSNFESPSFVNSTKGELEEVFYFNLDKFQKNEDFNNHQSQDYKITNGFYVYIF